MSGLVWRCIRFAAGCSAALLTATAAVSAQPRTFVVAPDGTDRAVGTLEAPGPSCGASDGPSSNTINVRSTWGPLRDVPT